MAMHCLDGGNVFNNHFERVVKIVYEPGDAAHIARAFLVKIADDGQHFDHSTAAQTQHVLHCQPHFRPHSGNLNVSWRQLTTTAPAALAEYCGRYLDIPAHNFDSLALITWRALTAQLGR